MFIDKVITTAWFSEPPRMNTEWQSAVRMIAVPTHIMGTRTIFNAIGALLPIKPSEKQGYRLMTDRFKYNGEPLLKPLPDPFAALRGVLTYGNAVSDPDDLNAVFQAMTEFESVNDDGKCQRVRTLHDKALPTGFLALKGEHYTDVTAFHVFARNYRKNQCSL